MELQERIDAIAIGESIDKIGVADLAPAHDFIRAQGGDFVASLTRGISLGIFLLDPIVDFLPHRHQQWVSLSYTYHAWEVINLRLDLACSKISSCLQQRGYKAFPVPGSQLVNEEGISAVFSSKLAAHLAGLGWIGKNCMVITPEHGPRIRWATVLTDAPLQPTGTPLQDRCGDCRVCVDACPVEAFSGRAFAPDEPREMRYDARQCYDYQGGGVKKDPTRICGMCLYACPYGMRGDNGEKSSTGESVSPPV